MDLTLLGASAELIKAFQEMDHNKIGRFLEENGGEWIVWRRNPPLASNMGGVWERQIRSARKILNSLLKTHGTQLKDESLETLLIEVEVIINSHPLTTEVINDVTNLVPLSPINLLTMKSKVVMPPPGNFTAPDKYSRKQWRRVQHVSNEFWSRWRKEVLLTLQSREKWNQQQRNCKIGDIALLKEDAEHNQWPMARIVDVRKDAKGDIRSVKLTTGRSKNESIRYLERPVNKLVMLLKSEE